jgi:glycosyltransferase involved in cell wall biosynthesis
VRRLFPVRGLANHVRWLGPRDPSAYKIEAAKRIETRGHRKGSRSLSQVLIISYNFPPDAEVGAKRVTRLCRYLPEFGISPIVLTIEKRFIKLRDESFTAPVNVRVIRTRRLTNPTEWYARWKESKKAPSGAQVQSINENSVTDVKRVRWLRRQILSALDIPDSYWGWYFPAIRAAGKFIQQEPISAIFSTGPPWTSHLIARHLKKKHRVPWIADFRDTWALDAWRDYPRWYKRIDGQLEASCVRWADLVLCVTEGIRTQLVERHTKLPAAKFVTLTNGFDGPVRAQQSTTAPRSQVLCLHLGELYAGRRIDTFCKALANLVHAGRLNPAEIKVLFLGPADPSIVASAQQEARELIHNSCIEFRPRVDWEEGQQILDTAKVLLIFQGNHPSVPAKFYEYLQTGKPIFALAKDGDLIEMMKTTGSGVWADPENPEDIANKLLAALDLRVRSLEEIERLAQVYHFRSLAERLAGMIRRVSH